MYTEILGFMDLESKDGTKKGKDRKEQNGEDAERNGKKRYI